MALDFCFASCCDVTKNFTNEVLKNLCRIDNSDLTRLELSCVIFIFNRDKSYCNSSVVVMNAVENLPVTWYNLGYDSNGKQKFTHTANLTTMKIFFRIFSCTNFYSRGIHCPLSFRTHSALILPIFRTLLSNHIEKIPQLFSPVDVYALSVVVRHINKPKFSFLARKSENKEENKFS